MTFICSCSTDKESKQTINDNKNSDTIPLTIFPGQGLETIRLNISTESDIMNFKNFKFAVDSGESIADGKITACHTFWKRIYNETNGLLFTFESECFTEPNSNPKVYKRSLVSIGINGNGNCCIQNGICIGRSTYDEIIKIYNLSSADYKHKNLIILSKLGITFKFNTNYILAEIELYEPQL